MYSLVQHVLPLYKSFCMQFPAPVSLRWIADLVGARIVGDADAQATGINEIHRVEPGDLVFVDHPKYYDKCLRSAASFIIINNETEVPEGKALLIVEQPFEAYCKIVQHFRPFEPALAQVSPTATVGAGTYIYPSAFIGNHVTIGTGCVIHPHVTILDHCIIGNNVEIQAGTVVGSDAFYYNTKKNRPVWYKRMPSCGRVVIEDDVEIGANCTIDRGVSHDTRIGQGTKMDNLIHVGHDTVLGPNNLIAAQVGIAGGVETGHGVTLWGQVGVSKTLRIGHNAIVLAQSGVPSSIEGNKTYFGTPTEEASVKRRELVWVKRIPEMWDKLRKL
jgi:UDP-3-O-[3-hydroxymyristoyl] glucosamine N-acyltransferase